MRSGERRSRVSGCDALNIVVNSGTAAGQDEPHYHVHIIPRREGDGFDIPLPFDGSQMPDRTVLDAYAARIIAALRDPMRASRRIGRPTRRIHAPSEPFVPRRIRSLRRRSPAVSREADDAPPRDVRNRRRRALAISMRGRTASFAVRAERERR